MSQEEYGAEGLDVASIPFRDNQNIIDLIAKRPAGLMPILEDQVRVRARGIFFFFLIIQRMRSHEAQSGLLLLFFCHTLHRIGCSPKTWVRF